MEARRSADGVQWMTTPVRLLLLLVAGAIAVAAVTAGARERASAGGVLLTENGQTVAVTEQARAAALTFTSAVPPEDRAWVLGAIAAARPEARALLDEVDGMTTVGTLTPADGVTLGVAQGGPSGFTVDLDLTALGAEARTDRATVVLHELGHVIDFALVDDATLAALDAQIPRGGPCGLAVGCEDPAERFADTFAKWALRGAVSQAGAGYGIAMPASIETWGEPLGRLALTLPK
jgi:hypothetical protein